jgi:site-specific recombinase XerD
MASVKLILDQRAPRKDGTCPVKLGVSHNGYFQISLGIHVLPENWIDGMIVFPASQSSKAKQLNEYARNRLNYSNSVILRLSMLGELQSMSDKGLRIHLDPNTKEKEPDTILVADQFQSFIDRRNKSSTAEMYRDTLSKIAKYYDIEKLRFEDITVSWLKTFESELHRDGLSVNSIARHFREIRAVYNDAIDYNVVSLASYPFRRFKIKQERTRKRSLTVEQLRDLRDYPCTESQRQYRDIFMLIFYLGGINLVDLFQLKEIERGYIYYSRSKTRRPYQIKVEPEAMEIIDQYRGKEHLLSHADRYANHEDFTRRINRALQIIGAPESKKPNTTRPGTAPIDKKNGVFTGLTTYWARPTLASLMYESDIPRDTSAKVLGHSENSVTDIYIRFDQKKNARAMRDVIDYVNGNKESSRLRKDPAAETK